MVRVPVPLVGVIGFLILGVDMDAQGAAALGQAASAVLGTALNAFGVGNGQSNPPPQSAYADAAQGTIRGKIRAAEEAGISKLYALGAPTSSLSMGVGGGPTLGDTISSMGADVSRAVAATQSEAERKLQALTLEKAGLENDYLRSQIASINTRTAREVGPPAPVVSAPGTVPERLSDPQRTAGINAGIGFRTNPYVSDAQAFTDRYGESEVLETLLNLVIGGADLWWNNTRPNDPAGQYSLGRTR